jgi:hypothetical protein
MIYDCFQFFNELDIIEIRFKELYDHVDFFILSESPVTHSGNPKPLYFAENKDRYARFLDKIIHLVPDPPQTEAHEHWVRENYQRNYIATELAKRCNDDDIIFITDADEITRGSKVAEIAAANIDGDTLYCLNMIPSNYYLNMQSHQTWAMGKVLRYGHFKRNFKNLTDVRNATQTGVAYNAGWHFSYMGGMERVREKFVSFAHQELNTPDIVCDDNLRLSIRSQVSCWHKPPYPTIEKKDATFNTNLPPADFSPFWRYYKPEMADLPKCASEYPHMLTDIHFSKYYFDNFENLYHLSKEFTGPGAVVELGSFEGYMSRYIANIFPDVVHCVDKWEDDKTFLTNMHHLTDGNYRIHNTDAIEFLEKFDGKIKFLYADRRYEADFLKKVIELFLSKAADKAVICGYDFCNEEVRKALFAIWPEIDTSGRFWFRQIP